ncbi:hypothetical protein Pmani_032679 [Petrolisthes manimaculis]|uniref:Major facilitator superfamily (MFS) profile domain-containing protein n=1 Tax=Petrolisthes manimaculis TaxID=1843537 RepID=A0AAE1NR95_9EUCA|nr:hypothetical protein Pmani_032679 [Petrolisthes manimaculis]
MTVRDEIIDQKVEKEEEEEEEEEDKGETNVKEQQRPMRDNVDERPTIDGKETVVGKWTEAMEGKEEVEGRKGEAVRGVEETKGRKGEAVRGEGEAVREGETKGGKGEAVRGEGETKGGKGETKGGKGEEGEEGEINPDLTTFEDLLEAVIGERGRWNYLLFFICSYGGLVSALQTMSYQVLGATPDYWCQVDQLLEAKWTTQQILNFAIPFNNKTGKHEGCQMYDYNYTTAVAMGYDEAMITLTPNTPSILPCIHREYDLSVYKSTITTDWDLVCERRAMYSTTQAATQIGKLLGYFLLGYILDVYGRRRTVLVCSLLSILTAFGMCFSSNIWMFIILKTFILSAEAGVYLGCFVTQMETCISKDRSVFASMFVLPWTLGYMMIPGIAYWVRTWKWLQAALSLPTLVFIAYYWLLPESPRWLVLQGRYDDALKVLKQASNMNGNVPPSDDTILTAMHTIYNKEPSTKTHTGLVKVIYDYTAILRFKKMRMRALIIFGCWFTCALVYYGVSLNATNLSTDVYLYIFLGGLLEVPSYILLWPAIALFGRVKSLAGLFFICGVSILTVACIISFLPEAPVWIATLLSLLGKMAITAAFHLVWLFTAELFPTYYRSIAIGEASVCGRTGSSTSPYINDILGEKVVWAPSLLFGIVSLLSGVMSFFLPETRGQNMPETSDFDQAKGGRDNKAFAIESPEIKRQQQQHTDKYIDANGTKMVKDAVNMESEKKMEHKQENGTTEMEDTKL